MKHAALFAGILSLFLSGCNSTGNHHNFPNTAKVTQCDNTFVLSGFGESVMLFEHETNGTDFKLLRWYDDDAGKDAFYDCQTNQIISIMEGSRYTSEITEGIRFYDLKDNHRIIIKTHEGFNYVVTRYKRGFIYSTAGGGSAKVDTDKYGYIPFQNQYCKGGNEELWLKEGRCVGGELYYYYVESKLFSIDEKKVIDTYPFDLYGLAELIGDDLYVDGGDYIKINLKTKRVTSLWNGQEKHYDYGTGLPGSRVMLPVNGIYYFLTNTESWDTDTDPDSMTSGTELRHFKKGALYQFKDKEIAFVAKLPLEDIVYANSPDKKHLYIFTKSRKVMKYDLKNNALVATYTIDTPINPKYHLSTVGFTKDNFILTFEEPGWAHAYVVVANRDFSQISKPYYIEMGGIGVATEQSIYTNNYGVY